MYLDGQGALINGIKKHEDESTIFISPGEHESITHRKAKQKLLKNDIVDLLSSRRNRLRYRKAGFFKQSIWQKKKDGTAFLK